MRKKKQGSPRENFIDLFAGCGGLSLGLLKAGWEGKFAIEKTPEAFKTLHTNLVDVPKHYPFRFDWPEDWLEPGPLDIEEVLDNHKRKLRKLVKEEGVFLVAGGPPCQGFSMAGKRNARDKRNKLVERYLEFVRLVNPRFILIENVVGILTTKKKSNGYEGSYAGYIKSQLESPKKDSGFHVVDCTLKAMDFGVPQVRPRRIFIGINKKFYDVPENYDPFEWVDYIRDDFLRARHLLKKGGVTVAEAIGDFDRLGETKYEGGWSGYTRIDYKPTRGQKAYTRLMRKPRNGSPTGLPNSLRLARHRPETAKRFASIIKGCKKENRKGVSLSLKERARHGIKKQALVVLDENKVSHTLTTLPDDLLHYRVPRILTVREYARLQSFPDWFAFEGKYTTGGKKRVKECPRYTQVGNAVPPLLAEFLGELVRYNHGYLPKK